MINRSSLIRNLSSVGVMRLGSAGLSFLLFWLLSRMLGSEVLGAFSLLFGTYLFAQYLPLLGLHLALVRDAALPQTNLQQMLGSALTIAMPTSIGLALLIALGGTQFYPSALHPAFWLVGLSIIPTAWTDVAEATLMGQQRMGVLALVNLGEALMRVLASVLTIAMGYGLTAIFIVFLGCRCLAMIAYMLRSGLPRFSMKAVARQQVIRYLRECPVFCAILILSMLASRADLFMLSYLVSLSELGIYAVGAKIYEAMLMVPSVVATALYPALSRAREQSIDTYERLIEQALFWTLIVGLPCMIALYILSGSLIDLLFKPEFQRAAGVLQWLSAAVLMTALDQVLACAMLAAGAQRKDLGSLILGVTTLIVLVIACARTWGIVGAAIAVSCAILVRVLWRLAWLVSRHPNLYRPLFNLLRPLFAGIAGFSPIFMIPAKHWAAQLLLSLSLYVLVAWAVGTINLNRLPQLRDGLKQWRRSKAG